MKIAVVLGTRPEIIKMSSIIRYLKENQKNYFIIHSNQHYSKEMDAVFFKDLELPKPKYNLEVGSGTHAAQTAKILEGIEQVLLKEKPDVILVQGDTNTVMAAALAASKLEIKVGHVEAGLRSYDRSMPEEINRIVSDHISDYLFPPTEESANILLKEGIDKKKIYEVGNTVVDAVLENKKLADKKSKILKTLNIQKGGYMLMTLHRPSNVDHKETLNRILKALNEAAAQHNLKIIFPVHPRTSKQLEKFKIKLPTNIVGIEPVGFLDMLKLQQNAKVIVTDSGGIQEEACVLKVPCVTIRENTERPESVQVGANTLAGTSKEKIIKSINKMVKVKTSWKNPFGSGKTGQKILNIIERTLK